MKKLLSAVLSLLMLAALSVPGFAEEALIVEEPAGDGAGGTAVSSVNFPDPVFRGYVSQNIDLDDSDSLSPEEIGRITSLDLDGLGIADLTGIRIFRELETLHCSANCLEALDVSMLPKLRTLLCERNHMKRLTVSGCESLDYLVCSVNDLTEADVSGCPNLTVLGVTANRLTALDLSATEKLVTLWCDANELKRLDLSGNPLLEYVDCSDNLLQELILGRQKKLFLLDCSENPLSTLDLENCPALRHLNCSYDRLEAAGLPLNSLPALEVLNCVGSGLAELDISGCPGLTDVWKNGQQAEEDGRTSWFTEAPGETYLATLEVSGEMHFLDALLSVDTGTLILGAAAEPAVSLDPGAGIARASGGFAGLYARVALVLDNNGVSGLYVTQAAVNPDGTIVIPAFLVPGLRVTAVNIALVPTLGDISSPQPTVMASDFAML